MIPLALVLRAASGTGTGKPVVGRQEAGLESYLERSTPVSSVRHLMAKTFCRVKSRIVPRESWADSCDEESKSLNISTQFITKDTQRYAVHGSTPSCMENCDRCELERAKMAIAATV